MKVLYVCPFAHDLPSYSYMAFYETSALIRAGVSVDILTFNGTLGEIPSGANLLFVKPNISLLLPIYYLSIVMRKFRCTMMAAKLIEFLLTITVAIKFKNKYDILHLREGDPFLFILHSLCLFCTKLRWVVVLIGKELTEYLSLKLLSHRSIKQSFLLLASFIMNGNFWQYIYRLSSLRNTFIYITENQAVQSQYEAYVPGFFLGKVVWVPLGVNEADTSIPREVARKYLGLSSDKFVFLCFGTPHWGKAWEVMYVALKGIKDTILLHAGNQRYGTGLPNSAELTCKYDMDDQVLIRDRYISEFEKPYYFFAADAIILSYTQQFVSNASSVWEACRFELPVIISDNPQLSYLIDSYKIGVKFKAGDSSSLRDAILYFISLDRQRKVLFGQNCKKFNTDFSSNRWITQCLDIYANSQ